MQKEIIKTSVFGTRVSLGHITFMYCDSAWQWPPLVSKVYHLTGMPLSKKVFFSASFNRALLPSSCSTPPVSDSALSWANTRSAPRVDLSEEGTDNLCAGAELITSQDESPGGDPQLQLSSLSHQALLGAFADRVHCKQPWPHNNLLLPEAGHWHQ